MEKKNKILNIIKWIFSIIFIIASIGALTDKAFISFIAFILLALLLLPPLTEYWKAKLPFTANLVYKGLIIFGLIIMAGLGLPKTNKVTSMNSIETGQETKSQTNSNKEEQKDKSKTTQNGKVKFDANGNEIIETKPKLLKEIVAYSFHPFTKPGYENITTYVYGLYINLPTDMTGVEDEVMEYLKEKSANVEETDAVHFWMFTDSTVIPKSFEGNWSTPKSEKKCFGHAVKMTNGNYSYDYDILGTFKR
jgi:hypothetical protein